MKMKKFGPRRGARPWRPMDPPMLCTDVYLLLYVFKLSPVWKSYGNYEHHSAVIS